MKIGEKWGYINKKGKVVIKPQFEELFDFIGGLARVEIDVELVRLGNFESEGNAKFVDINKFKYLEFKVGGKMGYIDKSGTYIWHPAK